MGSAPLWTPGGLWPPSSSSSILVLRPRPPSSSSILVLRPRPPSSSSSPSSSFVFALLPVLLPRPRPSRCFSPRPLRRLSPCPLRRPLSSSLSSSSSFGGCGAQFAVVGFIHSLGVLLSGGRVVRYHVVLVVAVWGCVVAPVVLSWW